MRQHHKFLVFLSAVIMCVVLMLSAVTAQAADKVNVDLTLHRTADSVKAGQSAVFELDMKISGANEAVNAEIGRDSRLVVQFPVAEKAYYTLETPLEDLAVNGVKPVYDAARGTLTYVFPQMRTGFSVRRYISLVTANGITPNGKSLSVSAQYRYHDDTLSVKDDDAISVTAAMSPTIHKELVKIVDDPQANAARPGYDVIYRIDATVAMPNGDHPGTLFLEPGSDVTVTDTLDNRLTYLVTGVSADAMTEAGSGVNFARDGQKLTWTFRAAPLEEQKAQGVNAFEAHVYVKVHISDAIDKDTYIDNACNVAARGLGEAAPVSKPSNMVRVPVLLPKGAVVPGTQIPVRITFGPGASGGVLNPNHGVDANQGVSFLDIYTVAASGDERVVKEGTSEAYAWNANAVMLGGYRQIVAYYTPSDNINLRSMHVLMPFAFQSANTFKELSKVPSVTAAFTLDSGSVKTFTFDFSHLNKAFAPGQPGGVDLAYEALGLAKNDKVKSFTMTYKNADGSLMDGEFSIQVAARYDVVPGTPAGSRLIQKVEFVASMADGTLIRRGPKPEPDQYEGIVAERYDTLVAPQEVPPTVEQVAVFQKVSGTEVEEGANRVMTALSNYASASALYEYPHSIVVLPLGVTIDPNYKDTASFYIRSQRAYTYTVHIDPGDISVFSDDYMGTGHQAILVKWNQKELMPKERLVAEFDVQIGKYAPDALTLKSYGFAKTFTDKMLQRKPTSPIVTETVDLNGDGITGRDIATSSTRYVKHTPHDVRIEKFVKGVLDADYSKFAYTTPGGAIDYKLLLTNTTGENIYKMGFLDVLPAVGDLEVIKNSPRGSAFTPLMTGPVVLPGAWQSKVDVYYSTAANPKRSDVLYDKVVYPLGAYHHEDPADAAAAVWLKAEQVADWSSIRSFKVELQPGDVWVKGQNLELRFSMVAPASVTEPYVISGPNSTPLSALYPRIRYAPNAAWNSFAITTNGILPTEPERVGVVVMNLPVPTATPVPVATPTPVPPIPATPVPTALPKAPKTGDTAGLTVYAMLFGLSAALLVTAGLKGKKKMRG